MYAHTTNMRIKDEFVIYITNLLLNISIEWNVLRCIDLNKKKINGPEKLILKILR